MPIFAKRTVAIHGFVGHLQLTVISDDEDERLFGEATERRKQLEAEIRLQVQTTLGPEFEVLTINLSRGSLHVLVALGAVGVFYMGFSRYENFIKSVNLLVAQLKSLLQRFFGKQPGFVNQTPVTVTGSWQPSSVINAGNLSLEASWGIESSQLVLAYLLLSHAALLGLLIWLVVRHLK